ncbi:hypothetical protein [Mucilaginibacter kameinonensis]|uniref:hypothetical protein n=1 Tax=Mucilaginibacter kameinonensis TaxID=452286 RepID=UPI0013CEC845|nr:hypothetical protein [Mucilaginibacter kameinonensis]
MTYHLHDLVHGTALGRLLVDEQACWIYDGDILEVAEQEELAGLVTGYRKEMTELLRTAGI